MQAAGPYLRCYFPEGQMDAAGRCFGTEGKLDLIQTVFGSAPGGVAVSAQQHQAFFFSLKIPAAVRAQTRDKREVQFFPLIARLKCGEAFGRYRGYRFIKDGIAQAVIMNKDRRINEACWFRRYRPDGNAVLLSMRSAALQCRKPHPAA